MKLNENQELLERIGKEKDIDLAKEFGVSRERIQQILSEGGVS